MTIKMLSKGQVFGTWTNSNDNFDRYPFNEYQLDLTETINLSKELLDSIMNARSTLDKVELLDDKDIPVLQQSYNGERIYGMIPKLLSSWTLMKTNKTKPTGYKGYELTIYDTDNITVIKEIRSKTAKGLANKIKELDDQKEA